MKEEDLRKGCGVYHVVVSYIDYGFNGCLEINLEFADGPLAGKTFMVEVPVEE